MSMMMFIAAVKGGALGGGSEPDPEYFDPMSGDITFTDEHFQDSVPGYAKTNHTGRSPLGFVQFRTSETEMDIKIAGDWVVGNTESDCEILVDGVYDQSVRVTASNTVQSIPVTLPSGEKIVTLINGYSANTTSITQPQNGVFVQGVVTTGDIEIKVPPTPTDKWVFVGDSITTGATGTHPAHTGFVGLFRQDGRAVAADSWGARRFETPTSGDGTTMATKTALLMNGSETNEVFVLLGTNNYGLLNDTKAFFKLYVQNYIDALHTLKPDAIVWLVSILDRTTYASGNSSGATGDDYADAMQELQATRDWTRFVYGKDLVSLANMPDGVHPNQTGHQEMHDNLLDAYNA